MTLTTGTKTPAKIVLSSEQLLFFTLLFFFLLCCVHLLKGFLHFLIFVQLVPLRIIISETFIELFLQLILGKTGADGIAVHGLSNLYHQRVKAVNSDKIAIVVCHEALNVFSRQTGPAALTAVAPVYAAAYGGGFLFQKGHQAVVAAGIADHNGGVYAERLAQRTLPLRL